MKIEVVTKYNTKKPHIRFAEKQYGYSSEWISQTPKFIDILSAINHQIPAIGWGNRNKKGVTIVEVLTPLNIPSLKIEIHLFTMFSLFRSHAR